MGNYVQNKNKYAIYNTANPIFFSNAVTTLPTVTYEFEDDMYLLDAGETLNPNMHFKSIAAGREFWSNYNINNVVFQKNYTNNFVTEEEAKIFILGALSFTYPDFYFYITLYNWDASINLHKNAKLKIVNKYAQPFSFYFQKRTLTALPVYLPFHVTRTDDIDYPLYPGAGDTETISNLNKSTTTVSKKQLDILYTATLQGLQPTWDLSFLRNKVSNSLDTNYAKNTLLYQGVESELVTIDGGTYELKINEDINEANKPISNWLTNQTVVKFRDLLVLNTFFFESLPKVKIWNKSLKLDITYLNNTTQTIYVEYDTAKFGEMAIVWTRDYFKGLLDTQFNININDINYFYIQIFGDLFENYIFDNTYINSAIKVEIDHTYSQGCEDSENEAYTTFVNRNFKGGCDTKIIENVSTKINTARKIEYFNKKIDYNFNTDYTFATNKARNNTKQIIDINVDLVYFIETQLIETKEEYYSYLELFKSNEVYIYNSSDKTYTEILITESDYNFDFETNKTISFSYIIQKEAFKI